MSPPHPEAHTSALPRVAPALFLALRRRSRIHYAGALFRTAAVLSALLQSYSLPSTGRLQFCACALFCSSPVLFIAHRRHFLSCCVPTPPGAVLVFSSPLCQHSRACCVKDRAGNAERIVPAMCKGEHAAQHQRKRWRCAKNCAGVARRRAPSQLVFSNVERLDVDASVFAKTHISRQRAVNAKTKRPRSQNVKR